MKRKLEQQCPECGKVYSFSWEDNSSTGVGKFQLAEKLEKILKSRKSPYEKKLALFNLWKDLEVGEMEPNERKRTDALLLGKVYNELAKQNLREYKKLAIDELKTG